MSGGILFSSTVIYAYPLPREWSIDIGKEKDYFAKGKVFRFQKCLSFLVVKVFHILILWQNGSGSWGVCGGDREPKSGSLVV